MNNFSQPSNDANDEEAPSIAPRPRAGFRSRDEDELDTQVKAAFFAALSRGFVGVICLFVSLLTLPIHMVTPMLSGVAIMMVVSAAYSTWRVGVVEPRLRRWTTRFVYGFPIVSVVIVLVAWLGWGDPIRDAITRWRGAVAPASQNADGNTDEAGRTIQFQNKSQK